MLLSKCHRHRFLRRCLCIKQMKVKHALTGVCTLFLTLWIAISILHDTNYVFLHENIHSKCILPDLDPFDPSMARHYMMNPGRVICRDSQDFFFFHNNGSSTLNLTSSTFIQLQSLNISCFYREIYSLNDFEVQYSREKRYISPNLVPSDSFQIICYGDNKTILYRDVHNKVTPRGTKLDTQMESVTERYTDLNVLIFGIDSLSRLAAHRALMNTMKYLKSELSVFEFQGYTKVGDNTFPNLIPLLTGASVDEWGYSSYNYADVYPFVWQNFARKNYQTFFAEDRPDINTFQHAMYYGFEKPPADHYLRPGFLALTEPNMGIGLKMYGKNSKPVSSPYEKSYLCHGPRPKHQILLDYLKNFLQTYKKEKFFGFLWTSQLGHANVGDFQRGDHDYKELFEWMNTEGILNNTVLFFLSDHGSRFDHLRNTYMGRIEDRMPLLTLYIPKHLQTKYPEMRVNLRENQFKVTSPFDVHHTLVNILHNKFNGERTNSNRGGSLFSRLPNSRSCADCGVPENYCTCYTTSPLDLDKPEVTEAANVLVQEVNYLISDYKECAFLKLKTVLNAEMVELGLKRDKLKEKFSLKSWWQQKKPPEGNPSMDRYLITVEVSPSGATYEGTVVYDTSKDNYRVQGEISRTNAYGETAWCTKDRVLRPFCFCRDKSP